MTEPADEILRRLLASGDVEVWRDSDRDQLVCQGCGGQPHRHRRGCRSLTWPVHVDSVPPRPRSLAWWRYWTGGQRPLLIHQGSFGDFEHVMDDACPCNPTRYAPEALS